MEERSYKVIIIMIMIMVIMVVMIMMIMIMDHDDHGKDTLGFTFAKENCAQY